MRQEKEQDRRRSASAAVAMKYTPELPAPFVIAKGRGKTADLILDLAREHRIPVVEHRIAREGYDLFLPGTYVPEDLYEVVATIFAFVYSIEKRSVRKDESDSSQ